MPREEGRRQPDPVGPPAPTGDLSGTPGHWLSRRQAVVLLAAAVVLAAILVLVLVLPAQLLDATVSEERERVLTARSQLRGQLLQAVGTLFFIVTAAFSWRQLRINQDTLAQKSEEVRNSLLLTEQQTRIAQDDYVTDRFSRSIEQLANESVAIRLGGIYVLTRLARASSADLALVTDVLSAFVRGPGASEPPADSRPPADPLRRRAPDVHAALRFLGTREVEDLRRVIDLSASDLRRADLLGARLARTDLTGALLDGALLTGAHLVDADLSRASLRGADLTGARLDGANLQGAVVDGAVLTGTCLDRANVAMVDFSGATLRQTSVRDMLGTDEAVWPAGVRVQGGRLVPVAPAGGGSSGSG